MKNCKKLTTGSNPADINRFRSRKKLLPILQVFLEPLKKVQVEGFVMCAEPEVLFGNLDELCCVTYAFCKEFINLLIDLVTVEGNRKYFGPYGKKTKERVSSYFHSSF